MGKLLLVDTSALPDVYEKVLEAKRLLENESVSTAAEAARRAGISRSAFYKYRDFVFPYDETGGHILTVHLVLSDQPGVLSAVLAAFAKAKANVLTVNQNIPAGGEATVSVSVRSDCMNLPLRRLMEMLSDVEGVRRASFVGGETAGKEKG